MTLRTLATTTLAIALACSPAATFAGGIPDPSLSTIPNVVASPGGNIPTTMTIVGLGGPVTGATVVLRYSPAAAAAACWCSGQPFPTVSAVTNGSGVAVFNVSGGHCLDPAVLGGVAIEVLVNDIKVKEVGQVSPDYATEPAGTCEVALGDAVNFTTPLSSGLYSFCFDLNSDGAVGLTDAVIFTPPASGAASCAN